VIVLGAGSQVDEPFSEELLDRLPVRLGSLCYLVEKFVGDFFDGDGGHEATFANAPDSRNRRLAATLWLRFGRGLCNP
jgi:hypothetical protein